MRLMRTMCALRMMNLLDAMDLTRCVACRNMMPAATGVVFAWAGRLHFG
jgi:hypothetical protein